MPPAAFDAAPPRQLPLADGATIAYRVVGGPPPPAAARTLLAFSGAMFNTALWRHAAGAWAGAGLRCVLHDCRGVGRSAAAAAARGRDQFTFDQFCDDAAALLRHLGIGRVVVVGMAWGARVALLFAAKYPGLAEACVLYDLSLGRSGTAEHSGAQKASLQLARDKIARLRIDEPASAGKEAAAHADRAAAFRATAATGKPPYDDWARFADIAAASVSCPVLIAMGEFDPNLVVKEGGARAVLARLRPRVPSAELRVMDAAGHASVKTNPLQCARVTVDFLRRAGVPPIGSAGKL